MTIETLQQVRAGIRRVQAIWRACHGPALTQRVPVIGSLIRSVFRAQRYLRPAQHRQWAFERTYPDAPWLTPDSVYDLDRLLTRNMIGIEFGSGRSTIWLGKRVAWLYSVEGDAAWYARTARAVSSLPVLLMHVPAGSGPTNYAGAIDRLPDASIDVACIDGHYRLTCLEHVLPKLNDRALLIVDNFDDPIYHAIRTQVKDLAGTKLYANGIWETAIFDLSHPEQRQFWQRWRAQHA